MEPSCFLETLPEIRDLIRCIDFESRMTVRKTCRQLAAEDPAFPAGWEWYRIPCGTRDRLFKLLLTLRMNHWPQLRDSTLFMLGTQVFIHWPYSNTAIYVESTDVEARLKVNGIDALVSERRTMQFIWARTSVDPPPPHIRGE